MSLRTRGWSVYYTGAIYEYGTNYTTGRLFDIDEALGLFAKEKNIDLIIAVQKQHSFFDKLFKKTGTTKKLSYQSEVPVLVVHE